MAFSHASAPLVERAPYEGGYGRRRCGRGFAYFDRRTGNVLARGPERARLEALAAPPAWREVWYADTPDAQILCCGEDEAGRRQYIYHPVARLLADVAKYERLPDFARALPRLREWTSRWLGRKDDPARQALAAMLRLIDCAAMRVGAAHNDGYGATTLEGRHVRVHGETVALTWTAKAGRLREVELRDGRLAGLFADLDMAEDAPLFRDYCGDHGATPEEVNHLIGEIAGEGHTAKSFRTWAANVAVAGYLSRAGTPSIHGACEAAAERLGNTPAICRSSYIHPALIESARDGTGPPKSPARLRRLRRDECLALAWLERDGKASLKRALAEAGL